jgi:hypothetical protein
MKKDRLLKGTLSVIIMFKHCSKKNDHLTIPPITELLPPFPHTILTDEKFANAFK